MSSSELHTLQGAFATAGGKSSAFVIWTKNTFALGRSGHQRRYEPNLHGKEGRKRPQLVRGAGSGR